MQRLADVPIMAFNSVKMGHGLSRILRMFCIGGLKGFLKILKVDSHPLYLCLSVLIRVLSEKDLKYYGAGSIYDF